jgi:probable HAF family extracellular repeat protein
MFSQQRPYALLVLLAIAGCGSDSDSLAPRMSNSSDAQLQSLRAYDLQPFDVPSAWGDGTTAFGINNAGAIVGNFVAPDGSVHGFLFNRGVFTDVTVPGAGPSDRGSLGEINDLGVAVGFYTDAGDIGHMYVRSREGHITPVPDAASDALSTDGTGINNLGTIVGTYVDAAGQTHGFVRRSGTYQTFDHPGALRTRLNGLNDLGQIAGQWTDAQRHVHGFILENGHTQPVDVPSAMNTRATSINNLGIVTGFYDVGDGVFHGFVYADGEYTTIDFPDAISTAAFGINSKSVFVGTYDDFSRGFVATPRHL